MVTDEQLTRVTPPAVKRTAGWDAVLLITLSVIIAFFGMASLTQATEGVGMIGLACYLAILGRIAQSGRQHR